MTDPTPWEAREVLGVSDGALSDSQWVFWLGQAKNGSPSSSDHDVLLYGGCFLWWKTKGVQYATSVGDRSFSTIRTEEMQSLYESACRRANVVPELVRTSRGLLKINSSKDDCPDLNEG